MGAMHGFLLTVIIANIINISVSQSPCVTPNGENGNCILFVRCEPFTKIWHERSSKNIGFFRQSHCGYELDKPLVCCGTVAEFTTTTPKTTQQVTTENVAITTKPTTLLPIPIPIITEITTEEPLISIVTETTTAKITTEEPPTIEQLFTSAITTGTPPTTPNVLLNRSPGFENHPNYNLLPPPRKCGLHTVGEKITNGNETDIDEYPWLAMLLYKQDNGKLEPNCGGSLINSKYVLTAAHCITGNLFSVRLGEYNVNTDIDCVIQEGEEICGEPHQEFEVDDFVIPTGYSNRNRNRHHDIALVRLKGEANITFFVRPICLPLNNERSSPGALLTASGWGVTEKNVTSAIKLAVDLPLWSDTSCREIYWRGYNYNISSMQLCAGGGPDEKDSCTGDSGGPLMQVFPGSTEFYVEGVVSFGPSPCGRQATPGVYIRVSEYVKWILDSMMP